MGLPYHVEALRRLKRAVLNRMIDAMDRRLEAQQIREEMEGKLAVAADWPLYQSGGTNWRCTRCGALAYADIDGSLAGCDCPVSAGPMPLVPTNPEDLSQAGEVALVEDSARHQYLIGVEAAARNLMKVLDMRSQGGKPVFSIAETYHTSQDVELLRHAVAGLQFALGDVDLPDLALPKRTH